MMRLMGALLLTAGSSALGWAAVRHLEDRVQDVEGVMAGLALMERELGWRMSPLPELFGQAAQATRGRPAEFFSLCAQGTAHLEGRTLRSIWGQALEIAQLRLEEEERGCLEQLGTVLGRYDGESQRQALAHALERMEGCRSQAREERKRLGKVYAMLGVAAGLFLVIFLL